MPAHPTGHLWAVFCGSPATMYPLPISIMTIRPKNMKKSVRASWSIAQNRCLNSIGNLVVTIATTMSISRKMEASEVNKPRRRRMPQRISTAPTKGAEN